MRHRLVIALMSLVLSGLPAVSGGTPIQFSIDGLDPVGSSFLLGIDFIDGDGPSNKISVANFSSNGSPRLATLIGGATVVPAGYILNDSNFFNSLSIEYTGASYLSFQLNPSNYPPAPGGFVDTLAVYLLDPLTGLQSIFTDEPLGSNALMSWSATGIDRGELLVYGPLNPGNVFWSAAYLDTSSDPVPEPSTLFLVAIGGAILALNTCIRKGKSSCA